MQNSVNCRPGFVYIYHMSWVEMRYTQYIASLYVFSPIYSFWAPFIAFLEKIGDLIYCWYATLSVPTSSSRWTVLCSYSNTFSNPRDLSHGISAESHTIPSQSPLNPLCLSVGSCFCAFSPSCVFPCVPPPCVSPHCRLLIAFLLVSSFSDSLLGTRTSTAPYK